MRCARIQPGVDLTPIFAAGNRVPIATVTVEVGDEGPLRRDLVSDATVKTHLHLTFEDRFLS